MDSNHRQLKVVVYDSNLPDGDLDSNVIVCDAIVDKMESLTFSTTETKIEMEEIVPKSEVPISKVSNDIPDPATEDLNFAADSRRLSMAHIRLLVS